MVTLYVAMDIPRWLRGMYEDGKKKGRWTSVEEFAREYGFHTATINRWMNERRTPEVGSCFRLAAAFGTPVDDVLSWAGHEDMSALFNVTAAPKTTS